MEESEEGLNQETNSDKDECSDEDKDRDDEKDILRYYARRPVDEYDFLYGTLTRMERNWTGTNWQSKDRIRLALCRFMHSKLNQIFITQSRLYTSELMHGR